jgi:hypothetical protein
MDWLSVPAVLESTRIPAGYHIEQLHGDDVPQVISRLGTWYPDIAAGAESCHLTQRFYHEHALLRGVEGDRPILPIVAKKDERVVAMITFEKNPLALTLTCRLGAIDPDHRGSGLVLLGPLLLEKIGRAVGAELAYYFATLKSAHQQVLAERLRFRLVGIVPAFDRDMVSPGTVKRVYEAIYAKVLVGADAVVVPEPDALTARTRAVWNVLFGTTEGD